MILMQTSVSVAGRFGGDLASLHLQHEQNSFNQQQNFGVKVNLKYTKVKADP